MRHESRSNTKPEAERHGTTLKSSRFFDSGGVRIRYANEATTSGPIAGHSDFRSTAIRNFADRMNSIPSAIAGVARQVSPTLFVASKWNPGGGSRSSPRIDRAIL